MKAILAVLLIMLLIFELVFIGVALKHGVVWPIVLSFIIDLAGIYKVMKGKISN